MFKLILGLLSALSLQASALDLQRAKASVEAMLKAKHKNLSVRLADPGVPDKPIRQAHLKAVVMKVTLTKNPQGGYDAEEEKVCSVDSTANVYDSRPKGGVTIDQTDSDRVQCQSTLNGQPLTLHIGGTLTLSNADFFGIPQDVKFAIPFFWYDNSPTTMSSNIAGSLDLNAKSILTVANQDPHFDCSSGSCVPSINEYFEAVLDFED